MYVGQRSSESSLTGSRAFLDTHADVLGVLKDSPARTQLDDAIQRVQLHAGAQDTAVLSQAVVRESVARAAQALVTEHMRPIATFARVSLKGSADFAALTKSASARPSRKLVASARAMATAATPLAAQFTAAKFPADFAQQLGTAADQLENAMASGAANKANRIAATSGIATALKDGRDAIRMIDPVVTRMLKGSELLAAWRSVKRVRSAATIAAPAPVTPAATSAATPAATPAATATAAPAVTPATEVKAG